MNFKADLLLRTKLTVNVRRYLVSWATVCNLKLPMFHFPSGLFQKLDRQWVFPKFAVICFDRTDDGKHDAENYHAEHSQKPNKYKHQHDAYDAVDQFGDH